MFHCTTHDYDAYYSKTSFDEIKKYIQLILSDSNDHQYIYFILNRRKIFVITQSIYLFL